MFYTGKRILLTGASSGIGKALAMELARFNTKLVLVARNIDALTELKELCKAAGSEASIIPFDLADTKKVPALARQVMACYQGIDVLINNAGVSQRAFTNETPLEVDRKIMELNYFSVITLTKALLPHMLQQGEGYIAVTSSISGKFGFPLRSAYAASKHALHGFFETLRAETHSKGIRVLIACPGRINTPISMHALNSQGKAHGKFDPGQAKGMPAEVCAKKYLKAIRKDKKEVLIGGKELLMVYIHKYFPNLFFTLARRIKPT